MLGSETLLYGKLRKSAEEQESENPDEIKSIVDDVSNLIA